MTSIPEYLLGSPKCTGLWDSYLIMTRGPFSNMDDMVFLSQNNTRSLLRMGMVLIGC